MRFNVKRVFHISSRGRCVSGKVEDGIVCKGMYVRPERAPPEVRFLVQAVEYLLLGPPDAWEEEVSLVFGDVQGELEEFRRIVPPGTILVDDDPLP